MCVYRCECVTILRMKLSYVCLCENVWHGAGLGMGVNVGTRGRWSCVVYGCKCVNE